MVLFFCCFSTLLVFGFSFYFFVLIVFFLGCFLFLSILFGLFSYLSFFLFTSIAFIINKIFGNKKDGTIKGRIIRGTTFLYNFCYTLETLTRLAIKLEGRIRIHLSVSISPALTLFEINLGGYY